MQGMQRSISPVWMVLTAIASVQLGAAIAKTQFDAVTPTGMAWLRLVFAGLILASFRPSFRGLTRRDWLTGLALASSLALMNWSIYEAFARIPLGLAVTVEFMGPLLVALAGVRRLLDLMWVFMAGTGVVLLGLGPTELHPVGVAFAILAAAGWAGYILLGAKISPQWNRSAVLLLASILGSVLLAGPAISSSGAALFQPRVLAVALVVGVLSSVLPYSLELRALRVMPTRIFGILQSLGPVAAALAGLLILREVLGLVEWVAIVSVVAASVGVTWRRRRPLGTVATE